MKPIRLFFLGVCLLYVLLVLVFLSSGCQAQQSLYLNNKKIITDSSGTSTAKVPFRFLGIQTDFGYGSAIFNLRLENDEGTFHIRKNGTDLVVYDDDDHTWDFKYPITVNGSSVGGGDAYLTNRQTFTKRNVFSDTIIGQSLSIFDRLRITSNVDFSLADLTSDLQFIKGANTWIKTADSFKLMFGVNSDTAMEIQTNNHVRFYESVDVDAILTAHEIQATDINALDGQQNFDEVALNDLTINNSVVNFGSVKIITGSGEPEGVVTAPIGSMYLCNDCAPGNQLFIKEDDTIPDEGWQRK